MVETGEGFDDVAAVAMFGDEREAWEKEQAQQQAMALKKQKQYQKALAKIQSGDYQIQVRMCLRRDKITTHFFLVNGSMAVKINAGKGTRRLPSLSLHGSLSISARTPSSCADLLARFFSCLHVGAAHAHVIMLCKRST